MALFPTNDLMSRIRAKAISGAELKALQARLVLLYDDPTSDEAKKLKLHEKLEALNSYFVATQINPVWSAHARYMCSCKAGMRNCICTHTALLVLMLDTSIKMPVELETRCARLRDARRKRHARAAPRGAIPPIVPEWSGDEVIPTHPPPHARTHPHALTH